MKSQLPLKPLKLKASSTRCTDQWRSLWWPCWWNMFIPLISNVFWYHHRSVSLSSLHTADSVPTDPATFTPLSALSSNPLFCLHFVLRRSEVLQAEKVVWMTALTPSLSCPHLHFERTSCEASPPCPFSINPHSAWRCLSQNINLKPSTNAK